MALASLLAVTLQIQLLARNQTEAVRLAQDKLDELMSLNFDTEARIQLGGSLDVNTDNYFDTSGTYTRRWLVEAGPDGSADLRQITMRVIPESIDRRTTTPYDLVTIVRRW